MTTGRPLLNRRSFLRHSALAGTALALAGDASPAPAPAGEWFDRPMRWGPLALGAVDAGRERPRHIRPQLLAGLLPAHAFRRRLSERGRVRGLLSHADSAA